MISIVQPIKWFVFFAAVALAQGITEPLANVARGLPVSLRPKPNHYLFPNKNAELKLTDGIKEQRMWQGDYADRLVVWSGADWIDITLDLQRVYLASKAVLNVFGGEAPDMDYPEYAVAAVSLDGIRYQLACLAAADDWFDGKTKGGQALLFSIDAPARYVKLLIRPTGLYFFADELEVYGSPVASSVALDAADWNAEQLTRWAKAARHVQRQWRSVQSFLQNQPSIAAVLERQTAQIARQMAQIEQFRLFSDLDRLESELCTLKAEALQKLHQQPWFCAPTEPMAVLYGYDMPARQDDAKRAITLYLWRNEHSAAAVNVTNCLPRAVPFKASVSPLSSGQQTIASDTVFQLRRAVFVPIKNIGYVADPLVLQQERAFTVFPGQTAQIWLDVFSGDLPAGTYRAALAVMSLDSAVQKKECVIPIELEISPQRFADRIDFRACNWDYASAPDRFTGANARLMQLAVEDLAQHSINVNVIRYDLVSAAGKALIVEKLHREIALKDSQKPYTLLFLGGKGILESRLGRLRTADFEKNFAYLVRRMTAVMQERGYGYSNFAMYPFDEEISDDFAYVARLIRQIAPQVKIYANKIFSSEAQFQQLRDLIDIWCPHLPEVLRNVNDFKRWQKTGGFEAIWCYYANISKTYFFSGPERVIGRLWRGGPNATSFRTMPLVAMHLGMQGAGFWVYQDHNKAGWTEEEIGEHGVVYNGALSSDKECAAELIVPSKRWRQWREGVEDAVCLAGHPDILEEFFNKPNWELTSAYLMELRKRADKKHIAPITEN